MDPTLQIIIILIPIPFLLLVSYPSKPRVRIRIKKSSPLVFPKICPITGEPATEQHVIQFFKGNPYMLYKNEFALPFSAMGWTEYSRDFPVSLKIFKGGLNILMSVPLFGAYLALYIWAPFMGFICGIIAIIDLLCCKRQLIKFHSVDIKEDGLIYGIDMMLIKGAFAEEFIQINTLSTYERKVLKRQKIRFFVLLFILLILVIIGLLSRTK